MASLLIFCLCLTNWDELPCPNGEVAAKALTAYRDGLALLERWSDTRKEGALLKAEAAFLKARSFRPRDDTRLCYIYWREDVVRDGPRTRIVRSPENRVAEYLPNKMLARVRRHLGPLPWANVMIVPGRGKQQLLVTLGNRGKGTMEDVVLKVYMPATTSERKIETIHAGSEKSVSLSIPDGIHGKINIVFEERYGIVPCEMALNI